MRLTNRTSFTDKQLQKIRDRRSKGEPLSRLAIEFKCGLAVIRKVCSEIRDTHTVILRRVAKAIRENPDATDDEIAKTCRVNADFVASRRPEVLRNQKQNGRHRSVYRKQEPSSGFLIRPEWLLRNCSKGRYTIEQVQTQFACSDKPVQLTLGDIKRSVARAGLVVHQTSGVISAGVPQGEDDE